MRVLSVQPSRPLSLASLVSSSLLVAMSSAAPSSAASAAASSASPLKRVYFMRHGETTFNAAGRMQGLSTESVLTAKGHLGARLAARYLESERIQFDAAFVSQLPRAKQTAAHLCSVLQLPPAVEDALLNERAAGRTEGLTRAQIDSTVRQEPDVKRLLGKSRMCVEVFEEEYEELTGVESFASVRKRASAFLRRITQLSQRCIVVVSHGRFLSTLFTMIDGSYGNGQGEQHNMSNCTITEVWLDQAAAAAAAADAAMLGCFKIARQIDGDSLFNKGVHSFLRHEYASDHWAMVVPPPNLLVARLHVASDGLVSIASEANAAVAASSSAAASAGSSSSPPLELLVSLHPFDSRGYRSIVRLWCSAAPASVLNRPTSLAEDFALVRGAALVAASWKQLGLIAQTMLLGNNSHEMVRASADGDSKADASSAADPALRLPRVQLGTPHEPCFPHAHVICRGDPAHPYVPGVPLGGPDAGAMFGARGSSDPQAQPGDRETPWEPKQLERVRGTLVDLLAVALEQQTAADVVPASSIPAPLE